MRSHSRSGRSFFTSECACTRGHGTPRYEGGSRLQDGRRELLQQLLVAKERFVVLNQSVAFRALDGLAVGGEAEVGAVDLLGYDPLAVRQLLGNRLRLDQRLIKG